MNLLDYIGRFHPVIVHLPIGIILAAILVEVLSHVKGFRKVRKSVKVLLVMGFASAFFAALTGLLHAQTGEFEESLVNSHRALAIVVTLFALVALMLHGKKKKEFRLGYFIILFALAILMLLTGHTGGSITHGEDYLKPGIEETEKPVAMVASPDNQLYADLVAPIFKKNCVSCHGPLRQKGKLRLDQPEFILKGGEEDILAHREEGELWRRINLDRDEEDHMPPKQKKQLTRGEISVITFWLDNGAKFSGTLASMPKADSILKIIGTTENIEEAREVVSSPDEKILDALRSAGVTVSFLSRGDGRISLQFMNVDPSRLSQLLAQLQLIGQQVTEIKMPGIKLAHAQWAFLKSMTSLERIHLEKSSFSDNEIEFLNSCGNLKYLNLVNTSVTAKGLTTLSVNGLLQLYVYQTGVSENDLGPLREHLPKSNIVLGNYKVLTLASDTMVQRTKYIVPE